jgi:hypothetical protein
MSLMTSCTNTRVIHDTCTAGLPVRVSVHDKLTQGTKIQIAHLNRVYEQRCS